MAIDAQVVSLADAAAFASLLQAVKVAKKRVLASIFIVDARYKYDQDYHVRTLLAECAQRAAAGVDVRIVVGQSNAWGIRLANITSAKYLAALQVPTRVYATNQRGRSSHAKFLVADDTVVVGSHNWACEAFTEYSEDSVLLISKKAADDIAAYFDTIWQTSQELVNSLPAPLSSEVNRRRLVPLPPALTPVSARISLIRNEAYVADIGSVLERARENVKVAMFFATGTSAQSAVRPLVHKLVALHKGGVHVQVLLDTDDEGDVFGSRHINKPVANELTAAGIEVLFDQPNRLLHSKIVVVDDKIVCVGSHNWTHASFTKYEELSVLIEAPPIAKYYADRFAMLWQGALEDTGGNGTVKNTYDPDTIEPYQYWARVVEVIDGDTVDCEIDLGFELKIRARVRLQGINTPEIFGVKKTSSEYKKGIAAKVFLESLIPKNGWVELRVAQASGREKYGRWLGRIYDKGRDLNAAMVKEKHAVAYP